jgi:single-strand DNA-binding protein
MARGISTVHLIGNLGHDPSIKDVSGAKVAEFSLAVNRGKRGEEHTDWYRLSLWRGLADIAEQYLGKGSPVYVEGELTLRAYTGRDGKERTSADVNVSRLAMLGSAEDRARGPQEAPGAANGSAGGDTTPPPREEGDPGPSREPGDDVADDLPF